MWVYMETFDVKRRVHLSKQRFHRNKDSIGDKWGSWESLFQCLSFAWNDFLSAISCAFPLRVLAKHQKERKHLSGDKKRPDQTYSARFCGVQNRRSNFPCPINMANKWFIFRRVWRWFRARGENKNAVVMNIRPRVRNFSYSCGPDGWNSVWSHLFPGWRLNAHLGCF